jgi:hypothetical protein
MTTAVKPLAEHGTTARAKGRPASGIRGCPCRRCRKAENAYDKRRRYLNATGRTLTVPVEPIAQHLDLLFKHDAGWVQLAQASKVSQSNLSKIRRRLQPTVARHVAQRILAVQPGQAIPDGRVRSAAGSIRRAQALMAIGHRMKDVYTAAELDHTTVSDLIGERLTTVTAYTARRMAAAYEALANSPGTSVRSINRARRLDWHDPLWWEDMGHIDDPDFDPAAVERELNRDELAAIRRNEIELLHTACLTDEEIATRVGVAPSTVNGIRAELRAGTRRDRRKQVAA